MTDRRLRRWVWLVVWLLVPALLVGCNRRGGGTHHNGSSGNSDSSGRSGGADGPDLGDLPVPDLGSTDGGAGGSTDDQERTSDGSGETAPAAEPSPESEPEPASEPRAEPGPTDPTEDAFRAVAQGTCIPTYRDGKDWVVPAPPPAVSCQTQRGELFFVTRVADSSSACPSGPGRDAWTYSSSVTGNTTAVCLNRVWVKNYCVLAEQYGDNTSIGTTTSVRCDATRVPAPYNQVLVIAGAYQVPSTGADTSNCPTGPGDNRRFWSVYADDGRTLVCFTVRG
ncbi:hypothetical protein [Streptodolium elevatio]